MTDTKSTITLFDGTNSQPQTHFLNTVTTISYVFSPAMNERLHAALVQICMVIQTVVYLSGHCHNAPLNTTLCSHPLFGLQKHLVSVNGCHFFFSYEGIQIHTFASYTFLCQTPLCQTAPLLPPVTQQQNVMGIGGKVQLLLPYHLHPPLTSWANVIK